MRGFLGSQSVRLRRTTQRSHKAHKEEKTWTAVKINEPPSNSREKRTQGIAFGNMVFTTIRLSRVPKRNPLSLFIVPASSLICKLFSAGFLGSQSVRLRRTTRRFSQRAQRKEVCNTLRESKISEIEREKCTRNCLRQFGVYNNLKRLSRVRNSLPL